MDLDCKRCNHNWMSRTDKKPKVCPACNSPYWEKELTPYWKAVRDKNKEKRR